MAKNYGKYAGLDNRNGSGTTSKRDPNTNQKKYGKYAGLSNRKSDTGIQNASSLDWLNSLDQDVLDRVRTAYQDGLVWDITDPEDMARKAAGQMPKNKDSYYNLKDPLDAYLYEQGLPSNKSNYLSKQYQKYLEEIEGERAEEAAYTQSFDRFKDVYFQTKQRFPEMADEDIIADIFRADTDGTYQEVANNLLRKGRENPEEMSGLDFIEWYENQDDRKENPREFTIQDLVDEYQQIYGTAPETVEEAVEGVAAAEGTAPTAPVIIDYTMLATPENAGEQLKDVETLMKDLESKAPVVSYNPFTAETIRDPLKGADAELYKSLSRQRDILLGMDYNARKDVYMAEAEENLAKYDAIPVSEAPATQAAGDMTRKERNAIADILDDPEFGRSDLWKRFFAPSESAILDPNAYEVQAAEAHETNLERYFTAKFMTDEEKGRFSYLVENKGAKAALEYWAALEPILNERNYEQANAEIQKAVEDFPALHSVATVIGQIPSAVEGVAVQLGGWAYEATGGEKGREVTFNDPRLMSTNYNTGIRQGVSEKITADHGQLLALAYDMGMSLADNAFRRYALGPLGVAGAALSSATMYGSGAASTTSQYLQQGASAKQALTMGVISGAAEAIGEAIDLAVLWDLKDTGKLAVKLGGNMTKGQLLRRNLSRQMLTEAGSEGLTEVANMIFDMLVMQDEAEVMQMYNSAIQKGATKGQALSQVVLSKLTDVGIATLGGALSGLFFEGMDMGGTAIRAGRAAGETGASTLTQGLQYMTDEANATARLRILYEGAVKDGTAMDPGTRMQILSDLQTVGLDEKLVEQYGETLDKFMASPRSLSSNEFLTFLNTVKKDVLAAGDVAREISIDQKARREAANQRLTGQYNALMEIRDQARAALESGDLKTHAKLLNQISGKMQQYTESYANEQRKEETAQAHDDLKQEKANRAVVEDMNELSRRDAAETAYQAEQLAAVAAEAAVSEVAPAQDGPETLAPVTGSPDTETTVQGESGALEESSANNRITPDFAAGVNRQDSFATATREERQAGKKLNRNARQQLRILDALGKKYNTAIVTLDSIDRVDGSGLVYASDANGAYDPKTGTIYLALDAEQGAYLFFAVHELTHKIKAENPAGYQILRDFVLDALENNPAYRDSGITLEQRIQQKQAEYGDGLTDEEALEEVICDTIPVILSDESVLKDLVRTDRTLAGQIRDFFEDFYNTILNQLDRVIYDGNRMEAAALAGDLDTIRTIADLFNAALGETGGDAKGETRYSPKIGYTESGRPIYTSNFAAGSTAKERGMRIVSLIQNVWSKNPILLEIEDNGEKRVIQAKFDPRFDETGIIPTDVGKIAFGNRKGNSTDRKVTTKLADDLYEIISDSKYNGFKEETGKGSGTHQDVKTWRYFTNEISFVSDSEDVIADYDISVDVKETSEGNFVYSVSAEMVPGTKRPYKKTVAPGTLLAPVDKAQGQADAVNNIVRTELENSNPSGQKSLIDLMINPGDGVRESRKAGKPSLTDEVVTPERDYKAEYQTEQQSIPAEESTFDVERALANEAELERVKAENERLAGLVSSLKEQMVLTKGYRPNEKALARVARNVLKQTASKYSEDELKGDLRTLFDYLGTQKDFNGDEAMALATQIARKVLEQSTERDTDLYDASKGEREYFRENAVYLSEEQKAEVARVYGSWNDFRKSMMGKIKFGNHGVEIDTLWQEAREKFHGIFDEEISAEEMPVRLAEYMNAVYERPYINPYGTRYDMDEASYDLAASLFDAFFNVPQVKTFADKQRGKLDEANRKYREEMEQMRSEYEERYEDAISLTRGMREIEMKNLKAQYESAMGEQRKILRDQYRSMVQHKNMKIQEAVRIGIEKNRATRERAKDRQQRYEYRRRIEKNARDLLSWLTKPTKEKHVPQIFQGYVADLLESIDIVNKQETERTGAWLNAVRNLSDFYRDYRSGSSKVAEDFYATIPDAMFDALDMLKTDDIKRLGDLSTEQLRALDYVVAVTKGTITNVNKMFRNARYKTVSETAELTIEDAEGLKQKIVARFAQGNSFAAKATRKVLNGVDALLNVDMLDAFSFGKMLGNSAESVIKSIEDGMERSYEKIRIGSEFAQKAMKDAGVSLRDVNKWSEADTEFKLESGRTVRMTVGQAMSIYALRKRPQALLHMLGGGIEIEARDGKAKDTHSYKLTQADLDSITRSLSSEQRKVMDALQGFLSNEAADWGNEAWQEIYLYEMFKEENYWPIKSAKGGIQTQEPDASRAINAMLNMGSTKSLNANANNPILIGDAFDTFASHVAQMARLNGLAAPIEDAMKWYNYISRDDNGVRDFNKSTKKSIDHLMGSAGNQYFVTLIKDINGLSDGSSGTAIPASLLSNYKRSAVAANLRVVVQQPTSIVRAISMMSPKYFANKDVKNIKANIREMRQKNPLAWWKAQGNYEIGTGRSMRGILFGPMGKLESLNEKLMSPAGWADDLAWGWMWSAVKDEVRSRHPEIEYESESYFDAVRDRFNDVVNQTQVVDSVLHRSQAMRSKDLLAQTATSFMSEPTKTYNMVRNATMDLTRKKPGAWKRLVRSLVALLASIVANNALKAVYDTFKNRKDGEEWSEKWKAEFVDGLKDDVKPWGYIPYFKDAASILEGKDVERTDLSAISDVYMSVKNLLKHFSGESNYTGYKVYTDIAKAIGSMSGIPVSGLLGTAETIANAIDPGVVRKSHSLDAEERKQAKDLGLNVREMETLADFKTGMNTNAGRALGVYAAAEKAGLDYSDKEYSLIAQLFGLKNDGVVYDGTKPFHSFVEDLYNDRKDALDDDLKDGRKTKEKHDEEVSKLDEYWDIIVGNRGA